MDAINWHTFFFLFFAIVASVFAVALVVSANIVRMALYLILSLGATSGLFFLAGADFVGAMQLMIYVGGTVVLLVFGVMLTAQGPFVSLKTRGGDWIAALLLSGCLLALLVPAAFALPEWRAPDDAQLSVEPADPTAARIGLGVLGVRVDQLDKRTPANLRDGMSSYLLPFEIVSIHLLVVLVGAAYLARSKKRRTSAS